MGLRLFLFHHHQLHHHLSRPQALSCRVAWKNVCALVWLKRDLQLHGSSNQRHLCRPMVLGLLTRPGKSWMWWIWVPRFVLSRPAKFADGTARSTAVPLQPNRLSSVELCSSFCSSSLMVQEATKSDDVTRQQSPLQHTHTNHKVNHTFILGIPTYGVVTRTSRHNLRYLGTSLARGFATQDAP